MNPGRMGRYDLIAELASGGMATVFLARLSGVGGFQRNVAIKCLHPHLAKNREFVEMFLDEARLVALIHHPNVVPILEVEASELGYYLVMEYIEGDTAASLLFRAVSAGQAIPVPITLKIVADMLAGLQAAHELRDHRGETLDLVHRDVSPQNVLVGIDGVARIADFGVARAASRLSATRAGQLKGKLAYMAPEQADGDEDVDRRADIFSAGVVLWEMLALTRLFKASTEPATLNRVLTADILSPRELNAEVSEELAAVCLKALRRDKEARFVSCAEFGDALEKTNAHIASSREVAAYVAEVIADDVESHRQAIRAWLDKKELSRPGTLPPKSGDRRSSTLPPPLPSRFVDDFAAVTTQSGRPGAASHPPPPPRSLRAADPSSGDRGSGSSALDSCATRPQLADGPVRSSSTWPSWRLVLLVAGAALAFGFSFSWFSDGQDAQKNSAMAPNSAATASATMGVAGIPTGVQPLAASSSSKESMPATSVQTSTARSGASFEIVRKEQSSGAGTGRTQGTNSKARSPAPTKKAQPRFNAPLDFNNPYQ